MTVRLISVDGAYSLRFMSKNASRILKETQPEGQTLNLYGYNYFELYHHMIMCSSSMHVICRETEINLFLKNLQ